MQAYLENNRLLRNHSTYIVLFIALFIGLGSFQNAGFATYVFSPNGDDSTPGVAQSPLQSSPLKIGWWTGAGVADMSRIDTQKANGETMMVAYTSSSSDIASYLSKLQEDGITAFIQVDPVAAASANTSALTSFVDSFKSSPAIAGWYLYDEADFSSPPVSAVNLIASYQAIKAADPNRPVAQAFGDGYCSYSARVSNPDYYKALDIIMFDQYPVHDQPELQSTVDGHYQIRDVWDVVTDCLAYIKANLPGKQLIPIEQGFNWGGTGRAGLPNRNPTYAEERYFTFMPLTYPVAGITYWADYHNSDSDIQATVNRVMKEASSIGSVFVNGIHDDPSISVSNPAITYKYGSDRTNMYLVAANNSPDTVTAQFTLPTTVTSTNASLLYDGYDITTGQYVVRSIVLPKDASGHPNLTDTFTKYQVHIYQLSGTTLVSPTSTVTPTPGVTSGILPD